MLCTAEALELCKAQLLTWPIWIASGLPLWGRFCLERANVSGGRLVELGFWMTHCREVLHSLCHGYGWLGMDKVTTSWCGDHFTFTYTAAWVYCHHFRKTKRWSSYVVVG